MVPVVPLFSTQH